MKDFIGIVGILVVFCALIFLAYVTTKFVGTKAGKSMKGKYINIIDTVNIGLDKQLHLIKVENEYVLIASAGKSIEFLTTLKLSEIASEESSNDPKVYDFKNIFNKYIQVFKEANTGRGNNRKEFNSNTENKVFKNNIKKLKAINQKFSSQTNSDGDGLKNEK